MKTPASTSRTRRARLAFVAPLVLVATGVALALLWPSLPERWPTHWNAAGQVDGWSSRTFGGVFGPIVMGLAVWLLLEGLAYGVFRSSARTVAGDPNPRRVETYRDSVVTFIRLLGVALAVVFSALALLLPLASPAEAWPVATLILVVVTAFVVAGMVHLARTTRRLRASGDGGALEGWNGLTYRNPKDPRLFVPRPFGMGTTLNFARPAAWAVLGLLLAIPALIVVLALTLAP